MKNTRMNENVMIAAFYSLNYSRDSFDTKAKNFDTERFKERIFRIKVFRRNRIVAKRFIG